MADQPRPSKTKSAALFPGVPIIESPVFGGEDLTGFTEKERALSCKLHSEGFGIIDFPDPEINLRIERIKNNLGPYFGIPFDDPAADKTKGEKRIQDAWHTDEDVRAIACNPIVIDLLSKLYGRRAFPFQTLNFPVGSQQPAHTDTVHFSCLPERFMCGVWLAMEDIVAEAGPVFYVSGSHRWPILTNAMIGRRGYGSELRSAQLPFADGWKALCETHGKVEEPFLARRGQALIWTANLLHGGMRQTDRTLTRWSQVTHYYFEDCIYYTPALSDEALGQLAFRDHVSIVDQLPRSSSYLGEVVRAPEATEPKVEKPRMVERIARRILKRS